MKIRTVALHSLGCKVNTYETDVMKQLLSDAGYQIVPFEEKADAYIVNTCTVTNIADRKSRQMLHRAKKQNPDSIVIAVGCYVQADTEHALKEEGIDLCIGNNKKSEIVSLLAEYESVQKDREVQKDCDVQEDTRDDGKPYNEELVKQQMLQRKTLYGKAVTRIGQERNFESMQLTQPVEHCRAFIKIQDGCNQFCSYCMIPYARGRVRSRKPEEVLEEIGNLSRQGYREFVITGIHLSSYGSEWEEADGISKAGRFYDRYLLDLLRQVSELPGVRRIRLGSLEPTIVTEGFVQALTGIPKLCPHFHLSLQSGCDETLKRMNRRYTTKEYAESVALLRKYFEHPAITTDVIVGFPGETEEEFECSRNFLEQMNFFEMHVFKYSKRRNTPAAVMPGQLTEAQKTARSEILLQLTERQSEEYRRFYTGKTVEVLFEEKKEIKGVTYWIGHTPQYVKVAVRSDCDLQNRIENVKGAENLLEDYLTGELCGN